MIIEGINPVTLALIDSITFCFVDDIQHPFTYYDSNSSSVSDPLGVSSTNGNGRAFTITVTFRDVPLNPQYDNTYTPDMTSNIIFVLTKAPDNS